MIKNLHKILSKYLMDLNIKKKLLLSYFVLIIIPLGLLTYVSYKRVSEILERQIIFSAMQTFEQTYSFLTYKLDNIINVSDVIIMDREIQDILTHDIESYEIGRQYVDASKLTIFFSSFQKNEDIYRIRLYVRDGLTYSDENVNFFNTKHIIASDWYKKLLSSRDKILWCPPQYLEPAGQDSEKVISAARSVRNVNQVNEIVSTIRIDILESTIKDVIKKAKLTETGFVYLENENREVVCSSNEVAAGSWALDGKVLEKLTGKNTVWETTEINEQKVMIGYKKVKNTDWKLISVIPYREILSPSVKLRNQMYVLMVIIGAIAYILAYYISNSSTKRIKQLIKIMRKVEDGNFDISILPRSKDEIGELIMNFNYMITKMAILIDERFKMGQEVKNADLRALQAQINPHFLYNTLDLINWMSIRNKVPDIAFMVLSLAKYYKLSLGRGRDIVTIEDEITHVKIYIQIQNKRFDNSIKLELDIDEKFYGYSILKIVLQPVIENSILHGILEKEDKKGTIKITGRLEDDVVILCIQDDGIGMSAEKIRKIFVEENSCESQSYGVRNINDRIKLYYGSQYGLFYQSVPGKGTIVEIRIPAIKTDS